MTWFVITMVMLVGLSTICWSILGAGRIAAHRLRPEWSARWHQPVWDPSDVAVIIAARNEEMVLPATLRAAKRLVEARQIFVVSDASTDRTAEIARAEGARVMELVHNRGKAGAIVAGLRHFEIPRRFGIVMFLDADTHPSTDYLASGLPLFNQPEVVAVAGRASTLADSRVSTRVGRVLLAHRERTYIAMQTLHKFGQAARGANAVTIIPGFASMYRTNILHEVDIAAPGLAIEDYNMTFEIHAKGLGRVAFDPGAARAYTQDPDTLGEYVRQMSRWSLGFWQTTLRHRVRFKVFWAGLILFAFEVFVSSLLIVVVPVVLAFTLLAGLLSGFGVDPNGFLSGTSATLPAATIALGILVPDVLLTLYAAVVARDMRYVLFGPTFLVLRILDAMTTLRSLKRAVFGTSTGVWRSPVRR